MKNNLIFCLLLVFGFALNAQPNYEKMENYRIKSDFNNPFDNLKTTNQGNGKPAPAASLNKITLEKKYPESIKSLMELWANLNTKYKETDGFRIQLVSSTDQNVIRKNRIDFIDLNKNLRISQVYERPYYKLRVGDFLTKFEAEQQSFALIKKFPAAFVVNDKVKTNVKPTALQEEK